MSTSGRESVGESAGDYNVASPQVDRSGGVSDSGGRNRGDNYDNNQDNRAELHHSSSSSSDIHGQADSDGAIVTSDEYNNIGRTHGSSRPLVVSSRPTDPNLFMSAPETGANSSPGHESTRSSLPEKDEKLSASPMGRRKVTFNSDTNNNDLDHEVDSSNDSGDNYGKSKEEEEEDEEEENDSFGSFGDIPNLHNIGTLAATTATISSIIDNNQNHNEDNNTASDSISAVRRRNLSKRTYGRENNIDLIEQETAATAAIIEEEEEATVPEKLYDWDEQQRYKKQKLKIMKADGSSQLGATSGKTHNASAAYFCRLSKSDFNQASETHPTTTANNKSSQSDIFKCNNKDTSDNGSSLFSFKNLFAISHFRLNNKSNASSKLKRSNEIKLQDWKEQPRDDISQESEDTSSVTDEDKSSDMANMSKDGYKTFKSSKRRPSGSNQSRRESQHRLSQTSGYSKLDHHHYQTENKHSVLQEFKRVVLLLVIILISCLLLWQVYELLLESYNFLGVVKTPSILGEYKKYAVSTDAEPCAKVGSDLLANGGSAVDAAIGTLLCMGVILPNSLGLGGGCLMTIYDAKTKQSVVIDGRETAPDYAEPTMFAGKPLSASRGPLSVGVPGELAAYWQAHQRFGKLKWSHLFNDSIKFAEEGYPMVEHLADALRNLQHAKYMDPQMRKLYTSPQGGEYYKKGEVFAQPALAKTLKRLRDNGVDEFYKGQTGQNFIQDLKDQGGKMTLENLMKYEALIRPPLKVKLADDLVLHTLPPPGSGIVLSIILRLMHKLGYYKNLEPQASFEAAELYYHRLTESFKFAYGQRAGLEDTPDDPERMKQLMDRLLSDKFIEEISSKVDSSKTHDNDYYGGLEYFSDDHGTAHVSVLDAEGNAAAVSTSVNLYFGAGIYSPSTGITYNDVMDDFVSPNLTNKFGLAPSKYNRIKPGRRPLSSMVPSVFTDSEGNVKLVLGGAGGTKITTGVAMVSLRNTFLGEDIKTSVDGPRLHHQFLPNKILYEINFPKDIIHSLSEIRNHTTEALLGRSSIVMAIASERLSNNKTRITANSDYRKGGSVHGE